MPKKFKRCVHKVRESEKERYGYEKYNPFAVCRKSIGYYGSTHHSRKHNVLHKLTKHNML